MRLAFIESRSERRPAPLGRRAFAFVLAIAIQVLLIVMLLGLGTLQQRPPEVPPKPITFDLQPPSATPAGAKTIVKSKKAKGGASKKTPVTKAKQTPPTPVPPPVPTPKPLPFIPLSSDEMAAADITHLPVHQGKIDGEGSGTASAGSGHDSVAVYGPGEGPGGVQLFNAEWYHNRPPTQAELAFYLPASVPEGAWGEIACKTVDGFRVEDCSEIGQSPAGSGIARALRQAAWQFRVMPPRINGKPEIGQWVRIHIDFSGKPRD